MYGFTNQSADEIDSAKISIYPVKTLYIWKCDSHSSTCSIPEENRHKVVFFCTN